MNGGLLEGIGGVVGVTLAVLALVGLSIALAVLIRTRHKAADPVVHRRRLISIAAALATVALLTALAALNADSASQEALLGLLGIAATAVIAVSSTTLVANAMAGLMLRLVRHFRPGDFVSVEGHFGGVTGRGVLATQIQTEDSDITTLPNLYLVTHPVKVVRQEGTIVSATVSLGYDVHRKRVDELLLEAASEAGLREPFVQVADLGDFSVTYRVGGFLADVRQIVSTRSSLRGEMLDALHGAGIEVVSPTFMNQRVLGRELRFVPSEPPRARVERLDTAPEDIMFDQVEEAGEAVKRSDEELELTSEIAALKKALKSAAEAEQPALREQIDEREVRLEALRASEGTG